MLAISVLEMYGSSTIKRNIAILFSFSFSPLELAFLIILSIIGQFSGNFFGKVSLFSGNVSLFSGNFSVTLSVFSVTFFVNSNYATIVVKQLNASKTIGNLSAKVGWLLRYVVISVTLSFALTLVSFNSSNNSLSIWA